VESSFQIKFTFKFKKIKYAWYDNCILVFENLIPMCPLYYTAFFNNISITFKNFINNYHKLSW